MAENLSVSWDEYQKNICKGLGALQQRGEFVDMTLAADGHHVKVHQMVLSLVSPFIKELVTSANCPHPVIFLNRVSYETMQAILEYAYTGEVLVKKDKMGEFLEACKDLHIKGLENMLHGARTTVTNIYGETRTERQPDPEGEDNTVPLTRRRKRPKYEEIIEVTPQFDEDDLHHGDVTEEVQIESVKHEWSPKSENNEDSVDSVGLEKRTENPPKKAALQYSVSCQGNLQVVVNRYLYALRHIRKNDERFWRCISQQKTGCPAIVTTLQDTIMERSFPHNHNFHDAQIVKRVRNGNMFTSVHEVEDAAAAKKRKKDETDLFKKALNETI